MNWTLAHITAAPFLRALTCCTLLLSISVLPGATAQAAVPAKTTTSTAKKPSAKKKSVHKAAAKPGATAVKTAAKKPGASAAKTPVSAKTLAARRAAAARRNSSLQAAARRELQESELNPLEMPPMELPLADMDVNKLRSQFLDKRVGHVHRAIDIMQPKGTPILAVADGKIAKLYRSKLGGISVYLFDNAEKVCFFYAHLDHYASGLQEGQIVNRGDVLGYVGNTGNAKYTAPHLHFAIKRVGENKAWSGGAAVDPYPALIAAAPKPVKVDTDVVISDELGEQRTPEAKEREPKEQKDHK